MVIFIPPIAITLIAATIFVLVLLGMTDWWELIALAVVIGLVVYYVMIKR